MISASIPNPVPGSGHFKQARPGHFWQAPKGLVGKLEVRTVALAGIGGTGALGFAALHHPLQNRTFAEILDLFQASSEFQEALRVAFQRGIPLDSADSAFGNRNA